MLFADYFKVWSLCVLVAVFCLLSSTKADNNVNNLSVAQISKGSERFALELLQVIDYFDYMTRQRLKYSFFSAYRIFCPKTTTLSYRRFPFGLC